MKHSLEKQLKKKRNGTGRMFEELESRRLMTVTASAVEVGYYEDDVNYSNPHTWHSVDHIVPGSTLRVRASGETDLGSLVDVFVDFGDGSSLSESLGIANNASFEPQHTFSSAATRTISAEVRDYNGNYDSMDSNTYCNASPATLHVGDTAGDIIASYDHEQTYVDSTGVTVTSSFTPPALPNNQTNGDAKAALIDWGDGSSTLLDTSTLLSALSSTGVYHYYSDTGQEIIQVFYKQNYTDADFGALNSQTLDAFTVHYSYSLVVSNVSTSDNLHQVTVDIRHHGVHDSAASNATVMVIGWDGGDDTFWYDNGLDLNENPDSNYEGEYVNFLSAGGGGSTYAAGQYWYSSSQAEFTLKYVVTDGAFSSASDELSDVFVQDVLLASV
jgi:hypothetical protein